MVRPRRPRRRSLFPAVFLGTWVSFLPFWTLDRFRLPMVLPLIAGSLFADPGNRPPAAARATSGAPGRCCWPRRSCSRSRCRRGSTRGAGPRSSGSPTPGGPTCTCRRATWPRAGAYLDEARRSPHALPETSLVAARYFAAAGRPEDALRELAVFRAWRRDFEDAELLQARLLAARGERGGGPARARGVPRRVARERARRAGPRRAALAAAVELGARGAPQPARSTQDSLPGWPFLSGGLLVV